jgi:hypothetical protein
MGLMLLSGLAFQDQAAMAKSAARPSPKKQLSPLASPQENDKRIQAMQAKMEAMSMNYNARLQQLQATVEQLTAQISKIQGTSSESADVPSPKPTDAADQQGIGEELIFGDENAQPTTTPMMSVPSMPVGSSAGGAGISGRSILNGMTQPFSTSGSALGQSFNPDIVVTGDFTGHYGSRKGLADGNRVGLREAEFGFSAAIDPYAKGTFIFSKPNDGELEVEEGYATLLALPYGLQAKIGKMRSPFGKINVIHGHDLPQTDRPDVYTSFFGEDGLVESGVSLSKVLPTPWFSSVDVQLANGDTTPLFGRASLNKPLTVGRWKNFFSINDTQSLELGVSGAIGARGSDELHRLTGVEGVDITYRWLPPSQYHAFIWQTELLRAQRENPTVGANQLWGGYSFMEYKLNNRWSTGVRLDYTQHPELADAAGAWAVAPYVDFWESEFGRWRVEYKHNFGNQQIQPSNQAWVQYSVIMGLHPPHTF